MFYLNKLTNNIKTLVGTWCLAEVAYFFYVRFWVYPALTPLRKPQPFWFSTPLKIITELYETFDSSIYYFEKFLERVFLRSTNIADIYSKNYDSFLAWYLFMRHLDDVNLEQLKNIQELRNSAFKKFLPEGKKGYNENAKHCSLGLNKHIEYTHKPLILKCVLSGLELHYEFCYLLKKGFKKQEQYGISYWYFKHPQATTQPPILFFHGICTGWNAYSTIIEAFIKNNRTLILINYECIVLNSMCFQVPKYKQMTDVVVAILEKHFIDKISLVGHSWGTFIAGWIIKTIPSKICHLTLIDPISTFVPYPETIFEVCYKPPSSLDDYLLYYFLRTDLTVGHTLARHFAWYNMVLSYTQIPHDMGVVISISENDILLNSAAAVKITDKHIANLPTNAKPFVKLFWPKFGHGEAKNNPQSVKVLVETIARNEI